MKKSKQIIKRTLFWLFFLSVYVAALYLVGIHCPISSLLGFPCPTCGVTRALLSLLRFDFRASLSYHPLAVPLTISVWLLINLEDLRHKKTALAISLSVVVLNLVLYIFGLLA